MTYSGNLLKMKSHWDSPVRYELALGEQLVPMNELIGKKVRILYEGRINCKVCGRKTAKVFGQGFCYPCFMNAPENSPCIIRPELCEAHLGQGRDVAWEEKNHLQAHVVYLALSSGVKVGVTRLDQIPTRWIDQGAWKAIRLSETPYRQIAGQIEVALKDHIPDKTNWQHMLKNILAADVDLLAEKAKIQALLPPELQQYASSHDEILEIAYPVDQFPQKIKSLNLDKDPEIHARLEGIKGQYLLFEGGQVINVRKYEGYWITLSV